MNILHMKYAVEVARLGSLNKAAEVLLIAQPNISRSIKELEASLGITIFSRSAKGMVLTPEGEDFIGYAREILRQIDDVESLYKNGPRKKQRFSILAPHAHYAAEAFTEFSKQFGTDAVDALYREACSHDTVQSVLSGGCSLGLVRYSADFDKYFKEMFEEKSLSYEMVAEFSYVLLMNKHHPLANSSQLHTDELSSYIEMTHADTRSASISFPKPENETVQTSVMQKIFVFDRAVEYDILRENPQVFMWTTPVSQRLLDRYGLVQKKCTSPEKCCKDMLIYRNGYKLTRLDSAFITALCAARRRCLDCQN